MKEFTIVYEVISIRGVEQTNSCTINAKNKTEARKIFERENPKSCYPIKEIYIWK